LNRPIGTRSARRAAVAATTLKIVLKVKPKAKGRAAPRKRLLFEQTVKAGPAKATAYKRLKLIHR